jgi:nucleoside-diphosphate-sugar epimerase
MKALVTGSSGFLGRHFTRALRDRGYTVARADLQIGVDATAIFADRHSAGMIYDLVVHCAALEPHRAGIDNTPMHLASNLALDAAMFEWAHRTGQSRVLYISSCAAYPTVYQTGAHPYRLYESDADLDRPIATEQLRLLPPAAWLMPHDNYGWLKLAGERMAAEANHAGLPTHVVRPFSGYGEDQDERFPFAAFSARARRREDPFTIWGDGSQVRDWIHVSDVVNGALAVVDQDVRTPVNLCTGIGTSMAELVELFCKQAGYTPDIELRADKPAGVSYRVGDPTRMHEIYTARVSIEEGVDRALA